LLSNGTTLSRVTPLQGFLQLPDRYVRVDLRRGHRGAAEQLLDVPQLGLAFQKVRRYTLVGSFCRFFLGVDEFRQGLHPCPPGSARAMPRILVVEDEADIRQVLAYNLGQAGHEVLSVDRGAAALTAVREKRPDLVLLDLMLPDVSGLDICRSIKSDASLRQIPVIMLTARSEEIDRVVGFELGADDYVVKPFSMRELSLRVQAVLRRVRGDAAGTDSGPELVFGRLRVDRAAHRAWVDDEEVTLTPLEMKLLWTLYERRGRVQSRATLLDDVWEASPDNNTRTVDTHIKRLREKLGLAGAYVETVRGIGYRFADSPDDSP